MQLVSSLTGITDFGSQWALATSAFPVTAPGQRQGLTASQSELAQGFSVVTIEAVRVSEMALIAHWPGCQVQCSAC